MAGAETSAEGSPSAKQKTTGIEKKSEVSAIVSPVWRAASRNIELKFFVNFFPSLLRVVELNHS